MKQIFVLVLSLFFISDLSAQVHSQESFRFTDLVTSTRAAGMGGNLINVKDDDLSLAYANPALLNSKMDNQFAFSFAGHTAGSKYTMFSYAREFKNIGTFAVNFLYAGYGSFDETDNTGAVIGSFKASNTGINLAGSRQITDRFSVGAQLKFLFSNLERFNSFGMGIDLAGTYSIEEEFLTTSLVLKNMGGQLTSYYEGGEKTSLPFEIQLGVSKKMKHAPFRISIVMENLQKWDLSFIDPNLIGKKDPLTGEDIIIEKASFGQQLMLHFVFGGEVIITKFLGIQIGYNYRRRQELKTLNAPGIAGFSFGLNLKFGPVKIGYALANFNQAGSTNYLSFALLFSEMKNKKSLN